MGGCFCAPREVARIGRSRGFLALCSQGGMAGHQTGEIVRVEGYQWCQITHFRPCGAGRDKGMHRLSTKPICDVQNVLTINFFGAQSQCLQVALSRGKEMSRNGIDLLAFCEIIAAAVFGFWFVRGKGLNWF